MTINVKDRPVKLARTGGRRVIGFHGCLESVASKVSSAIKEQLGDILLIFNDKGPPRPEDRPRSKKSISL